MILRHLWLHEFRNYAAFEREFSPALNLLVGPNGQGKSNILEGIYLLATSKSMRGGRDAELIRWDLPAAVVRGQVLREKSADIDVEVALSRTEKKSLVVNTLRVTRAAEFIGQFKAVAFSAGDLEVVRGEPVRRRRFLDLEIAQLSPAYCHHLGYYRKVVEQRNRLLKSFRGGARSEMQEEGLAAWTEQLVQHGSRIVERRTQFVEELHRYAAPIHTVVTEASERMTVAYQPSVRGQGGLDEIAAAFRSQLAEMREEERRRQVSLVGPHRDDLLFLLNGRDARVYASQGQQRTAALSLKLAEIELMRDLTGESPVCLLDDVFSELDSCRRALLFDVVLGTCQTFLTTTDLELLPVPVREQGALLWVRDGSIALA